MAITEGKFSLWLWLSCWPSKEHMNLIPNSCTAIFTLESAVIVIYGPPLSFLGFQIVWYDTPGMFVLLLPLSDKHRNTKPVIQRQMFKFFFYLLPQFYTATHQTLSVLSYPPICHWLKSIQPSSLRDSLFWWEWWKLVCNTSLGIRRFRLRQACRNHQTLCEYGGLALIVSLLLGWVPFCLCVHGISSTRFPAE